MDFRSDKLRWGILGCARIAAKQFIPAVRETKRGEVAAVASRDRIKAEAFAKDHSIPRVFDSYSALVEAPEIDAIYIPLPTALHAEWCLKSLAARKPVLCEKPLAANGAEAAEVIARFKEAGVLLMEGLMYRFHPMTLRARQLIAEGRIGALRMVHSAFVTSQMNPSDFRRNPDLGGGALRDLGIYCIDVIRFLSDSEPSAIKAFARMEGGIDDTFCGMLQLSSGVLGTFQTGMSGRFVCRYEAIGDRGRIWVDQGAMVAWPGGTFVIHLWSGDEHETIEIPPANHYALLIEDFTRAVLDGQPPRWPIENAVANLKTIDALLADAGS